MPLYTSLSTTLSNIIPIPLCNFRQQNNVVLHPTLNFFPCKKSSNDPGSTNLKKNVRVLFLNKPPTTLKLRARYKNSGDLLAEESLEEGFEWDDQEQGEMLEDEEGSPWEGAVIYRRNASISHIEYCTTLERLGLGKLSTGVSKSRASELGLRVTKAVKDYPDGTPVLISVDVTRKKQKLMLDGIIKTVLSLDCNRCGDSAAKSIFENFSLLLTEECFEEPETINMGVIYGEENFRTFGNGGWEEEDDDSVVDFDDQLYFPSEDKEIDISKHIRDLLHVEITINEVCDPHCKGICLRCGTNLNRNSCKCMKQNADSRQYGPLGSLRKQMQQS